VNFLLDTHLLLWAAIGSSELPKKAAGIIADKNNKLVVSVASLWEVAIKRSKLGPDFGFDTAALRAGLVAYGYLELPVHARHVLRVQSLPRHHSDPFDRLFVAQAVSEGLVLLTANRTLAAYGGNVRVV
jgi:PIN domain nuclease of toxin-antitoxin system